MKTDNKTKTILAVMLTATLLMVSCHDEIDNQAPRFPDNGSGLKGLVVGVQNEWTPETRAANSSVTLLQPDQLESSEPLVVIIEDELTGDTTISSRHRQAQAHATRGMRYTNETETWDGTTSGQHYMHESFALFGMTYTTDDIYTDASNRYDFSNALLWDELKTVLDGDGNPLATDYQTVYSVLNRPESLNDSPSPEHYEQWEWGDVGEKNWPDEGNVMLFALAPAQTTFNLGINIKAASGTAPYFDYVVPVSTDAPYLQQDLMIAKRRMTSSQIAATQTSPDVVLDFQHICTAVKFKLASNNTNISKVKRITMKGVVNKARFTFDNTEIDSSTSDLAGKWDSHDTENRVNMTYDFGDDGVARNGNNETILTTDDNVFMMIPQTFDSSNKLEVTITFIDADNEEVTLSTFIEHEWKPGHTVVYRIARAADVDIDDNSTFTVTAVRRTNNSTTRTEIEYDAVQKEYVDPKDIAFKVESYRGFTIGGVTDYADIPWEMTQVVLQNIGTYNTVEKHEMPYMITMDEIEEIDVVNPVTGETVIDPETNLPKKTTIQKTWGNGGHPEVLPFTVNEPSRRGTFEYSDAIVKVLNRNSIGTAEGPQDLSMLALDGTLLDAQSTANCYVVSAPGYYAIPLVYGNALINGVENSVAYSGDGFVDHAGSSISSPYISGADNACIVWSTSKDIITDVELSEDKQYITFKADPLKINLGNVLVAVRNSSNEVLWSWHIWVNDYDEVSNPVKVQAAGSPSYDFMEVNLGWTDKYQETVPDSICTFTFRQAEVNGTSLERTVTVKRKEAVKQVPCTGGTYYQSGRKDPFPSVSVSMTDTLHIWPEGEGEGDWEWVYKADDIMENANKYLFNRENTALPKTASGAATIADGIKNPAVLYLPGNVETNWFNGFHDNLWTANPQILNEEVSAAAPVVNLDVNVIKTIYDPCPVGWCIPNPGAFKALYTKTFKGGDDYFSYKYDCSDGMVEIYSNQALPNGDIRWKGNDINTTSILNPDYNTEAEVIAAMKSDLKKYSDYPVEPRDGRWRTSWGNSYFDYYYSPQDKYKDWVYTIKNPATEEDTHVPLKEEGWFAHASSGVNWQKESSGKFEGIQGLSFATDGKSLFLPSAGARNPDEDGRTELNGYPTFNYGGYYATAFSAPAVDGNGVLQPNTDSGEAATFFWIQKKELHDEFGKDILSVSNIPLFDPYNKWYPETQAEAREATLNPGDAKKIYIYRDSYWTEYWGIFRVGHDSSAATWGVTSNLGINLNGIVPYVSGNNGVWVYFRRKKGPLPYTTHEWARNRAYAVSVRPIKDKDFAEKVDVGIHISDQDGGSPYRDTRSRLRK